MKDREDKGLEDKINKIEDNELMIGTGTIQTGSLMHKKRKRKK